MIIDIIGGSISGLSTAITIKNINPEIEVNIYEKHKKILSGTAFYCYLRRKGYPKDPPLQVLCDDCNKEKQIQNKERNKQSFWIG